VESDFEFPAVELTPTEDQVIEVANALERSADHSQTIWLRLVLRQ
jgi:hypothetical protein